MPLVALFGARIRELLAQPLATDAQGCLTPVVLDLSPQARAEWIGFHDEVERELGARGAFRSVRDVAAKAALRALTKTVALEVGEYGIRCNCMVPGSIDTELWQNYAKRRAGEDGVIELGLQDQAIGPGQDLVGESVRVRGVGHAPRLPGTPRSLRR